MPYNPNKWGPEKLSSDSYEFLMQGANCVASKVSLLEHALTSPSQELSDPLTKPVQKKVRGRIVTVNKTVKPAEQTALTYTLLFPSALWTPALHKARQGAGCETDFYARYLCPPDDKYKHAYIYPDSVLDPPSEVEDFITNTTETVVLTEQTTLHTTERATLWNLLWSVQADETGAVTAVAFKNEECVGCSDDVFVELFAAETGGAGAPPILHITDDRFATDTTNALSSPNDSIVTFLWSDGSVVLMGHSDAAIAAGTAGGTQISFDDGATETIDSNLTIPIFDGAKFGTDYLIVGGTAAGAAVIYTSADGITWTAVSSSVLPATDALAAVAVDEDNGKFYAVGESGTLLVGQFSGSSIILQDLSANLPGSPGLLEAVAVLSPNHVIVGGAAGYCAESFDGGVTWTEPGVPGSSAITAIAGNCYRTLIGAGTAIYERSVLTNDEFRAVTFEGGVSLTGDITDIKMAPGGDMNYFAASTDDGEIIFAKPPYPNA